MDKDRPIQVHPTFDRETLQKLKERAGAYDLSVSKLVKFYVEYGLSHLDLTMQPRAAG